MPQTNVRVPQITSVKTAIRLFYEKIEIGNQDILTLFGKMGGRKILLLKRAAKEQMDEDEVPNMNALYVNTKSAYKAWGLDIKDLKERYRELKKLDS